MNSRKKTVTVTGSILFARSLQRIAHIGQGELVYMVTDAPPGVS